VIFHVFKEESRVVERHRLEPNGLSKQTSAFKFGTWSSTTQTMPFLGLLQGLLKILYEMDLLGCTSGHLKYFFVRHKWLLILIQDSGFACQHCELITAGCFGHFDGCALLGCCRQKAPDSGVPRALDVAVRSGYRRLL